MLEIARESNYWYVWPAMEIAYLVPDRKSHFSKKNQIRIKKYFLKKFSEPEKSLISQLASQYSELFL